MSSSDTSDPVAAATSAVIDARGKLVGARFKYYAVERAWSVYIVCCDCVVDAAGDVKIAERDYDAAVERCVRAYDANGRCKSEAMAAISAAIDDKARRDRAERKPSAYDAMQTLYGAVYQETEFAMNSYRNVQVEEVRVAFAEIRAKAADRMVGKRINPVLARADAKHASDCHDTVKSRKHDLERAIIYSKRSTSEAKGEVLESFRKAAVITKLAT